MSLLAPGSTDSTSLESHSSSSSGSVDSSSRAAAARAGSSQTSFRTVPLSTTQWPPGTGFLIANEAAERFSFYGMKAILVVFMTQYLRNAAGELDLLSDVTARAYFHVFTTAVYACPILGALVAEMCAGKYRTILAFSLVYCGGHLTLAINETLGGLLLGLGLISVGSGGIKPCVSSLLGDQFGRYNQQHVAAAYSYFYLAINIGAFASQLVTPALLVSSGSHAAFGVPGLLMGVATAVFFLGRRSYTHVPPAGVARFARETCSAEGRSALARLLVLYFFVAVYYSLFDQTGAAWVLQAQHLNRRFAGIEWLPSQIGAMNPLLILILVPTFNGFAIPLPRPLARACPCCRVDRPSIRFAGLYALAGRRVRVTPLRKMSVGFFVCSLSFCIPWLVETWIEAGHVPSIAWMLLSYVVLTSAEVLVSITGLEFSYTQAPRSMKAIVMALYLGATAAGNLLTAIVNHSIRNEDGSSRWSNVQYYRFFAILMFANALVFVPCAMRFREKAYQARQQGGVEMSIDLADGLQRA